jgi:nucleotide-binding universal stress UspA family protein
MLKHVVIPLDGSNLAEDAIEHALNIVEPNGKITLVSAVEVPDVPIYGYYPATVGNDYEEANNQLLPYARHYLQGIADDLSHRGFIVKIEAQIGDPAQVITDTAEKYKVDAIVMSTHGRSGLSRWLFGSVANKVLSAKLCPVYIIPSKETRKS